MRRVVRQTPVRWCHRSLLLKCFRFQRFLRHRRDCTLSCRQVRRLDIDSIASDLANRPDQPLHRRRRGQTDMHHLYFVIVIVKLDVLRPCLVRADKVGVAFGPVVLCVAREHALDAHTYALDILYGAPARGAQEVQADDAVGVDVRVHGYRPVFLLSEDDLGGFCGGGQ